MNADTPFSADAIMSPNLRGMMAASQRSATLTAASSAINLAIGEPDLVPPREVVETMKSSLDAGYTHYADFAGDPELREAIAELQTRPGLSISAANVQITSGATAALSSVLIAIVSPGDRVVMPDPTYSLYADLVRMAGGQPVAVPTLPDHHLDIDALRIALPSARAFVYCSPVNPTGAVYRRDELEAIGEILADTETVVIDDAAYASLVFDGHEYVSAQDVASLRDRTILCQTFSKKFSMTGFRVGYVVAPEQLLRPVATVHRTVIGAINSAAQRAALGALSCNRTYTEWSRGIYAERMQLVDDLLNDIPEVWNQRPEGAFYTFPKILTGHTSQQVVNHLLGAGVKVRAGAEFGSHGVEHLRISFATSNANLERGLELMRKGMATL